ncbi:hypothetical protein P8452_00763 [Trifolium repens]|nr:hypothetical protein P8452_00763 [Trifolium repens]
MEFPLFYIITFLMVVVVGTNGAILPPQVYWKSMLPNTPMPKAITNLLHPAEYWNKEKATWMEKLYDEKFVVPHIPLIYIYAAKRFANSIPFSSNKLENILDKFSIKKGSKEAEILKHTISECEEKSIKGEEMLCVTSLESMVDFTTSKLGNNVEVITTEVEKQSSELQEYVIEKGVKKLGDKNKTIVCHKENYPYAVFYCHKTDSSEAYYVPLKDVDGNRVKAIVVCHTDTSNWNPKVLAFQVLKVQPGTVPICHFVPQDHVVWISK